MKKKSKKLSKFSNSNLRGRGQAQPQIEVTTVDRHGHLGKEPETRQGTERRDKFHSRHLAVVKEKPCFDLILKH